jgi:hypothetical protein
VLHRIVSGPFVRSGRGVDPCPAQCAARPEAGSWARLGSVGFLFALLPAASRWLWAGSARVNSVRVCESLDVPRRDGIREAERASDSA